MSIYTSHGYAIPYTAVALQFFSISLIYEEYFEENIRDEMVTDFGNRLTVT